MNRSLFAATLASAILLVACSAQTATPVVEKVVEPAQPAATSADSAPVKHTFYDADMKEVVVATGDPEVPEDFNDEAAVKKYCDAMVAKYDQTKDVKYIDTACDE